MLSQKPYLPDWSWRLFAMTCACMRRCSSSAVRWPSRSGAGSNCDSAGSNMESRAASGSGSLLFQSRTARLRKCVW